MSKKSAAEKKSAGDGEISATIEESNEMRRKLGIKPLDESDPKDRRKGTSSEPQEGGAAANLKKKPTDKELEKQKVMGKNRKEHEEFTSGQGLGDILAAEGAGSASDWVTRTRASDGSMVKPKGAAGGEPDAKKAKKAASAAGLKGMKVRHDADSIVEGETTELVLGDKRLLDKDGNLVDDDGDELVNVRMIDHEKAKHNDAIRNQVEYDNTKANQNLLEKYDELKTGPKGFTLGSGGVAEDPEKKLAALTKAAEVQSLEMKAKLQADYYTAEEMLKMKKPNKKKMKKRKAMDPKGKDPENQLPVMNPEDVDGPRDVDSDEEDPELYEQLSKQRRLVKKADTGSVPKGEAAISGVQERIVASEEQKANRVEEEPAVQGIKKGQQDESQRVALTATTEFCNIVQTPIEKMETLKHEAFAGSTLYKQQALSRRGLKVEEKKGAGVKRGRLLPEEVTKVIDNEKDPTSIDEDSLDLSAASGLSYLRARSQIGCDQETHKNRKSDNRPLEMSTAEGDIKLEYRDDYGRVQTPKEAFRAISWKFHGKMPGRKNLERRLSRLENEMSLKSMNAIEVLPTLRALKHVQVADAKPYMVLSGQNEK